MSAMPLAGQVAVVAGATRGAGRGIARALGEAGAVVYCTGRSVSGNPSAYGRPETIDETAAMVTAAGGTGIAVRVDHTVEAEVEALFARVARDHGRERRQQHCRRGSRARRMGSLLADGSDARPGRVPAGHPLAPHHGQGRHALHDEAPARPHRRGDRRRYGTIP